MNEAAERDADKWYGTVSLTPPGPIVAGQMGSWRLHYRVGKYGVDNGGRIKIARRLASDWATPQFDDPTAADYCTVRTTGRGAVTPSYQHKGYYRPWFRTLTLEVSEFPLEEGDEVIVTLGDTSGGGPGTRAQTFRERHHEFRVLVESFETGIFVRVPSSPRVPIVGGEAARLVVLAPSLVRAGEPFSLTVKAEDGWGNPSHSYAGTLSLDARAAGLPDRYTFSREENGVHRFDNVSLKDTGFVTIIVSDRKNGLRAESNPIRVVPTDEKVNRRPYWADLHGQTETTVGTGTVEEYFRFARDTAAVDVCTHQGNDFQITPSNWREIQRMTRAFHQPGRFVTFLGYEWSGNTPAGGDHNVIWYADDQPIYRSSHWQVADESDAHTDRYPVSELYEELKEREALLIPHIGGRRAILDYHRPEGAPLIEICSVHGRFEWFLHEALSRNLRVGVVANGDDHTGRPGAAHATDRSFGVRGGLTCILAEDLTRAAIWEALRARRTYATTGERIYLSFSADGHPMGAEFSARRGPDLSAQVVGTAPLHAVQICNGDRVVHDHPIHHPEDMDPDRLRVSWRGARNTSRGRATRWDGSLTIAGGTFLEAEEFAFDNPGQGLTHRGERQLCWTSSTSGDMDGLLVSFEDREGAELTFSSGPCTFSFRPEEVRAEGPLVRDAGGVGQAVEISLAPARPGPRQVQFSVRDPEPEPGMNAYYLRVTQEDGEMAWSSPIYACLTGGRPRRDPHSGGSHP